MTPDTDCTFEPEEPGYMGFHRRTSPDGRVGGIPLSKWPDSWRTISFKGYPRFERVPLPAPECSMSLLDALGARESRRSLTTSPALGLDDLGLLLRGVGRRPTDQERPGLWEPRTYPSAGARYPLETYVLLNRPGALPRAAFHYHVRSHSLEYLWPLALTDFKRAIPDRNVGIAKVSTMIVLTGVIDRSTVKYGERGYRFALLEAGHAAQNLCLLATALGRSAVPIGGAYDEGAVAAMLDVVADDLEHEVVLYTLALF